MSINKYGDEKRRKASEAYRAKHGYDPSTDQLNTFMATYIATDGFGSGAFSGANIDTSSSYTDTSSGCDSTSSSYSDGGASASGSCDVSGGIS